MTFTRKTANRIVAVVLSCVVFIAALFMPSASVSAYAPANESLTYYMYSKSGDYTGSYALSELDTVSSNLSTAGINGTDDRTESSLSGVVKIILSNENIVTGTVVDSHVIATAADVLAGDETIEEAQDHVNNVVSEIRLTDGTTLSKSSVLSIHIPENFFYSAIHSDYDYAMIVVKEDLSDYICFNLGTILESYVGKEVYGAGYPTEVNGKDGMNDTENTDQQFTGKGTVLEVNDYTFNYDVDITYGDIGCPIYAITTFQGKEYYTLLGIQTYGTETYNFCTSFSPSLLHFYLNNPYITV